MKKEKIYITVIFILGFLALYFAVKSTRKIEVRFSKPVYPIGNYSESDKSNIWEQKQ